MAEYSTAQMDESLTEEVAVPEAAPKSWRRFGLVAAALGTVGAIFGMTRPQSLTPVQQMQQMAHASHSFMQAVVARALDDTAGDLSVQMGMIFAPKDLEDWTGLSVHAHLRPAGETPEKPFVRVTFMATEGKGQRLKAQLQKTLREAKKYMNRNLRNPQEVFDQIELSNDGDLVHVTVQQDIPFNPAEMDIETPTMELSLKLGASFQEIVDNSHGCDFTLLGGVNVNGSTQLAKAIMDTVGDELGPLPPAAGALAAFDKIASNSVIKYDEAALEKATCNAKDLRQDFRSFKRMKRQVRDQAPNVLGPNTVKEATKLKRFADHVHSLHVGGVLPNNYEIYAEFENFELTPVIADFLRNR